MRTKLIPSSEKFKCWTLILFNSETKAERHVHLPEITNNLRLVVKYSLSRCISYTPFIVVSRYDTYGGCVKLSFDHVNEFFFFHQNAIFIDHYSVLAFGEPGVF